MSCPSRRSGWIAAALVLVGCLLAPAEGRAQNGAFGMGYRFSLVRGDAAVVESADRYSGGMLRARLSSKSALEVALDYRSHITEDLTRRIRDVPIQASLLVYPVRMALSPYLLGGVGWYSQKVEVTVDDSVLLSETTRRFGYHAGLGGELRIGHVGLHADYRYTFIRFNSEDEAGRDPGALPVPGLDSLQRTLRLSHKGSMWTGGATVYF